MFYSPLRYPGGKRKLANYIANTVELNSLNDATYIEVYAGGSSVALSLLFQRFVNHIHINDFDPAVYNFWHSVLYETEELCKRIHDVKINMDNWNKYKDIVYNNGLEPIEQAIAFFFLNRTNRSGIIKAGVIGGKNQSGKWKMDVRFNKDDLIRRIYKIARHKNSITLTQRDACQLLKKDLKKYGKESLVYLDPPYYIKGGDLYTHNYQHDDHVKLAKQISRIKQHWIVSYDNVDVLSELYEDYRRTYYGISYTAQNKYEGNEMMAFSNDLKIIDVENPTKIQLLDRSQLQLFN